MKKFICLIILLLIPTIVSAKTNYEYIIDTDNKTIIIGDNININFDIKLTSDKTGYISKMKIETEYNDSILDNININSDKYKGKIEVIEDKKYIVLELKDNKDEIKKNNNKNIKGNITFKVVDTEDTNTEIKFKSIESVLTSDEDTNYKNDISKKITYIISKKVEEKVSNSNSNIPKSDNNYLKDLIIDNYNINFNKDKNSYDIKLEDNINKLDIKCILEDESATYEIKGNENLKDNNHVYINVISASGLKNTYVINIKKDIKVVNEKLDNKAKVIIFISSIIVILFFVLFILHKVKERNLDNILDKM